MRFMPIGRCINSHLSMLAAGSALLCAMPALADVKAGVDAWSRGDYSSAIRQWEGPAAKGDPDAQYNLAQAYKLGRGVNQDLAKAEQLFALAAAQGHLQASDNLGLLLFQRGERAGAMPYIRAASGRGDPRAHYVLGLAYFNGDGVAKDWERAYALVSLAQQAGLPQAAAALNKMDEFIPLELRQRSVGLAAKISAEAEQSLQAQVAAADLRADEKTPVGTSVRPFSRPTLASNEAPGADYTPGRAPPVARIMDETKETPPPKPQVRPFPIQQPAATKPAPVAATAPASPVRTSGPWRVQLGAFGVRENADRLWERVKARPELAGHAKLAIPAGRVTKLQAGGFADQASAQAACDKLKAGGFDCIAAKD